MTDHRSSAYWDSIAVRVHRLRKSHPSLTWHQIADIMAIPWVPFKWAMRRRGLQPLTNARPHENDELVHDARELRMNNEYLTWDEIAEKLGVTPRRLARARARRPEEARS